jgi:hypothetical protein
LQLISDKIQIIRFYLSLVRSVAYGKSEVKLFACKEIIQDSDLNGVFTQDFDLNNLFTHDSDLNGVFTQDSDLKGH